jgi:hypothetical protein
MTRFQCEKCATVFENEGEVFEYTSPVYGPCSKKVADCPGCGCKSDEFRPPKNYKKASSYMETMPAMGGCSSGGCCCKS